MKTLQETLRLLKRDWRYFLGISLLLLVGILGGLLFYQVAPQEANKQIKEVITMLKHLTSPNFGMQILLIWRNNVKTAVFAVFSGIIFPFPMFVLLINGVVMGILQRLLEVRAGIQPWQFYMFLAPHGILELPAIIMSVGLGIRFWLIPYRLLQHYAKHKEHLPLFADFFKELRYYGVFIILVLLVAAIVEVTISPMVMRAFGLRHLLMNIK